LKYFLVIKIKCMKLNKILKFVLVLKIVILSLVTLLDIFYNYHLPSDMLSTIIKVLMKNQCIYIVSSIFQFLLINRRNYVAFLFLLGLDFVFITLIWHLYNFLNYSVVLCNLLLIIIYFIRKVLATRSSRLNT